jgi:hypothetical protein
MFCAAVFAMGWRVSSRIVSVRMFMKKAIRTIRPIASTLLIKIVIRCILAERLDEITATRPRQ